MDGDKKSRALAIDSLKGIAILGIMQVHYSQFFSVGKIGRLANVGPRGVQLMFLISGCLTAKSLWRAQNTKESVTSWYKKELLRILPLF